MPRTLRMTPVALAAAKWKLRMEEEGPACYRELNAWLRQSDDHFEAYLCVLFLWRGAHRMKIGSDIRVRQCQTGKRGARKTGCGGA